MKTPSHSAGRPISQVIAELEARGWQAGMDDDFAPDIEAGIEPYSYQCSAFKPASLAWPFRVESDPNAERQ